MRGQVRVLLVEDDEDVVATVRDVLRGAGFLLEHAATLAAADAHVHNQTVDAIILDLGLPDGDGRTLAEQLRRSGEDVPILMLTAQTSIAERLEGFAHGADDYVCKPFVPEELLARLRALLRRVQPERRHIHRYAGAELDLLKRVVRYAGVTTTLSDREASLLAYFMKHPEQRISREQLAQEVFGLDPDNDAGVVNVYVNYLRNKLEQGNRNPRLIHTIRGVGYMLAETPPE